MLSNCALQYRCTTSPFFVIWDGNDHDDETSSCKKRGTKEEKDKTDTAALCNHWFISCWKIDQFIFSTKQFSLLTFLVCIYYVHMCKFCTAGGTPYLPRFCILAGIFWQIPIILFLNLYYYKRTRSSMECPIEGIESKGKKGSSAIRQSHQKHCKQRTRNQ